MSTNTANQYLGIANSLALVATFAGAFTYNSLVTLKSQSQSQTTGGMTENFSSQSTLLSISFILYTAALFVTIFIQLILRQSEPDETLNGTPRDVTRLSFMLTAGLIVAGFILLDITLIGFGETAVAGIGIATVGVCGVVLTIVGCCCKCVRPEGVNKKGGPKRTRQGEAREHSEEDGVAQTTDGQVLATGAGA